MVLENPQTGDAFFGGDVVIRGIAYDLAASEGTGVSQVSLFLGDRDQGGLYLGEVTLGQPNPMSAPTSQFAQAGFKLVAHLPSARGWSLLCVYATSSITGKESVLRIPIRLR